VPAMDQLQITIRELAIDINSRLEAMEDKMRVNPSDEETLREGATEFRTLGNLRSCLKSAASVVSSASTIYGYEKVGDGANAHDSDFGDVFPRETSSIMLSWIESNEITEAGEASNSQNIATGLEELRHSAPISAPGEWDSDEEEELEITQALFQQGLSNLKADEISEAEKHLRNCIDRLSNNQWPQSLANQLKPLRFDAMSALVTVLQKQQNWDDAEKLLKEKIILAASLHMHRNYLTVLDDTLMLSEVLLEKKDFTEALLYGRRVYRAFKKQSPQNRDRCASAILVIIRIYELSGNQSDAEAYIALFRQNFSQSTDETEHSLSREGVHMQYVQQQTRECGLQEQHPQSPQLGLSASEEPVETQKLQEAKEGQSTTSDSLRFDLKLVLLGRFVSAASAVLHKLTLLIGGATVGKVRKFII
jgi:tetratricopeptide (TPR) repeat protein